MNIAVPSVAVHESVDAEIDLAARVAVARVRTATDAAPNAKSLFSIIGLDPQLTCAIAKRVADEMPGAFVRVHHVLDDGTLDPALVTHWNTTDFRNMPREAGGGCIVFATPTRDLDVVGATAGEIAPISLESLANLPELWIEACPELSSLGGRQRAEVANFIKGLHKSGVAIGGLPMLARFVHDLNRNFHDIASIDRALDASLPAVRICRNAGRFKAPAQKGRLRSPATWAEALRELQKQTEDAVHLVNERGVELDRGPLRLRIAELKTAGRLSEDEAATLRDLVDDDRIEPGVEWRSSQEAVVQLSWEKVEPVFRAPKKTRKQSLGEETLAFFDASLPRELTKAEKDLLETVLTEEHDPEDEEKTFFFNRRDQIAEDKRLLKRWESYIFRSSAEHSDLVAGLLTTIADLVLDADVMPEKPRVFVRLVNADKLSYWKTKNAELATYLRDRYRGLDAVLRGAGVILDFGMLWTSSWAPEENGSSKTGPTARQFKIDVFLLDVSDFGDDGLPKQEAIKAAPSRQLLWSMAANSLGVTYSSNMGDIAAAASRQPLPVGSFTRAHRSERIVEEGIDLENRGSIQDVHGAPDGQLVDANKPELDAALLFVSGLEQVGGFLPVAVQAGLLEAMEAFRASYTRAIAAMMTDNGLASTELFEQALRYRELLDKLRHGARQDACRKHLWEPALLVGMAFSEDRPEVAIVTPWQPFRLAEAATKVARAAAAIKRILDPNTSTAASIRRFARGVVDGLTAPWHPSVAVRTNGPARHVFIETDTCCEFSLLESPNGGDGSEAAFDGYSREAAAELIAMANEYLALQPHERANFSVSLFNADNRELPSRLAERLARKVETEPDLRCDLILTHTDQRRLRQIYTEQNVAMSRELDGVIAGEAARTFLSRLRVGFLDADAVGQTAEGRAGVDIVFLHDVIARSAKVVWRRVDSTTETFGDFCKPEGEASSRKRPFESGARKTEVFLVPNERPAEVQSYLNLVHDLHQDDQDDQGFQFAPVREIVFDDASVGRLIQKAHQVGSWVVTFDAIADRQLLLNNGVTVIRFLPKPGLRHNVIVSTNRHERTLTNRLAEILGPIADFDSTDQTAAARTFIDQAAKISGKVVLHATRNEQNALELVGLVLSRALVSKALEGLTTPVAWLLIDDFAEWIAHPPGKKADILVVALGDEDGRPVVDLVVVESKFVGTSAETQEAKDALLQLKATTDHIRDNIVLDKDPLNRPTWLSRLADLVAEQGMFDGRIGGRDAATWASTLRSNGAVLRVRGAAFVFTHDRREGRIDPFVATSDEQREFLLDRHQIAVLLDAVHAGRGSPVAVNLPAAVSSSNEVADAQDGAEDQALTLASPNEDAPDATVPALSPEPFALAVPIAAPAESVVGGLPPAVAAFVAEQIRPDDATQGQEWLQATRQKLRVALRNYGFDAEIVGERLTPNAALVRFKGSDRLTVADVEKKQEVLLTSHGLDVVSVRPERGEVVVSLARDERAFPLLADLWARRTLPRTAPDENTSLLVGEREGDGGLLYLNLTQPFAGQPQHGPHTLIAGETGSGKGVLTRNFILDICATNAPARARVRMIDPKCGGDYPWIETLPHLDGGLVTSQDAAVETFKELLIEMESRYATITRVTSNIDRYNAKVPAEERLPRVYLFHDEMGDWMADKDHKDYRNAVESYVARLGMKARAAGIHLFLITQRPDAAALPGPLKANMNNKICLRVSSQTNSRIVLDENGAERLLGNGHLVAKLANERPSNQSSLIYAQAPFLDDDSAFDLAAAIVRHWNGG
jgi:S-DNA-T family DNA segregation ATPase FtsK/SpoIIIE